MFQRGWRRLFGSLFFIAVVGLVVVACQASATAGPAPSAQPATTSSKLIVSADVVQGSQNVSKDLAAMNSCVLSSRFPRNSEIVWRARVYDPTTGNLMNKTQLSKVEIDIANGKTVTMQYGPHPKNPPGEAYWTGSWLVPKDNPTGTLNFTIVATGVDGRTGEYKPFSVQASLPTITDQVLADIAPAAK